nr:MAG TPA: hypothetical protein [Caudoviricetes sp.]
MLTQFLRIFFRVGIISIKGKGKRFNHGCRTNTR